jgi:hypothetical protein
VKRTVLLFAAVGGLVVPCAFVLAEWALRGSAPEAVAFLRDVRLPLWPMSKLFDGAGAGRHWLYLPLATVLSNALLYAAVGALAAWGRARVAAYAAALALAVAIPLGAQQLLGSGANGLAVAVALAVGGLIVHRRAAPGAGRALPPEHGGR